MENRRAGFVALLGATNSGKSTLMNAVLGSRLSITSHKVQTTRSQIRGVKEVGPAQIVFVDTPGIFAARGRFDRAMVSSALRAMDDSDAVVFLLDATKGPTRTFEWIAEKLKTVSSPVALAINKVDMVRKDMLLALAGNIVSRAPGLFEEVFMISALENDGVDALVEWAASKMPEGEWYFEPGRESDMSLEFRLAEITRGQVYSYLHQEIPYAVAVRTDGIEEGRSLTVRQTVYAGEENHRSIILGAGGVKIKAIGTRARLEMERVLKRRVNLFLEVKVKKGWRDAPEFFSDMGLEFKG
jgi:GTP-binding protein Era